MWDVDSQDYEKTLTAEDIASRVVDNVRSGSIVVMHDGMGDRPTTISPVATKSQWRECLQTA